MGYDIGLKPVQRMNHAVDLRRAKYTTIMWLMDLVTTMVVKDVTTPYDANMYRIYANAYGKDVSDISNTNLIELANAYKAGIDCFVFQSTFDKLVGIVDHWEAFLKAGKIRFSIPTNCLNHFNNLLRVHQIDVNVDDTIQFNAFISSLNQNLETWNKLHLEDFDASKYLVPADRMETYIGIIRKKIDSVITSGGFGAPVDYKTKVAALNEYIKCLLLMARQVKIENVDSIKDLVFDDTWMCCIEPDIRESAQEFANKFAHLALGHVICIRPSDIETLKVSEPDSDTIDNTSDEYLLLYVTAIQSAILSRLEAV